MTIKSFRSRLKAMLGRLFHTPRSKRYIDASLDDSLARARKVEGLLEEAKRQNIKTTKSIAHLARDPNTLGAVLDDLSSRWDKEGKKDEPG